MEVAEDSSNNQPAKKKKRNLPGMPDPDAQVIALSPKTLMATNRFVCEICSKGFQRDQNLQLHRRGHNLPWKLRQRSTADVRKRVYVCPEPSCVHHHPSRALGDLTGIKKHFSRKHGEKKWKCDKCLKKYAVQSDWKAHFKTCGTRDYTCDCGTVFSRRDSFITHRAFCDALAQESAKLQQSPNLVIPSSPSPPLPSTDVAVVDGDSLSLQSQNQNRELSEIATGDSRQIPPSTCIDGSSDSSIKSSTSTISSFANVYGSSTINGNLQPQPSSFSDLICALALPERPIGLAVQGSATEHTSLSLSSNRGLFALEDNRQFAPPPQPTMSATALLQKAAQMGAAATSGTFLRGLGVSLSSSSGQQDGLQWSSKIEENSSTALSGHALGVPFNTNTRFTELMMTPSTLFSSEPTTLDFLGLGMGRHASSRGGLSALLNSIGGDLDIAQSFRNEDSSMAWKGENERKTD